MRVAYVCADAGVPVFGHKGCSVHVREMCTAMVERGFDVSLFAARRGGEAAGLLRTLSVTDLQAPSAADPESREREAIAANERTFELLAQAGPFDLVYERASLWSVAPMAYAAMTSTAGVLELNAPLVDEQARYRTLVQQDVARALLSSALTAATVVVAVSEEVAASAKQLAGESAAVQVVPNGVDVRRFERIQPGRSDENRFVIGFVGTLKPWHGLPTLLDAFTRVIANIPEARLLIVGDGPQRPDIERRLVELSLEDRVTMTGAVPHDEIPRWLARMDVGVAPYRALEDFYFSPLKVVEYMAAGLPVVASAIGQVTTLIHHDETGVLFAPGDPGELAAALERVHANERLRYRLGAAARAFVADRCTWGHVLQRVLDLAGGSRPAMAGTR